MRPLARVVAVAILAFGYSLVLAVLPSPRFGSARHALRAVADGAPLVSVRMLAAL